MGCGDSKDRKTVTAKPAGGPGSSSSRLVPHFPVQIPVREDPDDEIEVMTRAKKTKTIEEPVPAQPVFPDTSERREDHLEATQLTDTGEVHKAVKQSVRFKSGGGSAMEDLELLEASLSENSPVKETKKKPQVETTIIAEAETHVDDLLEDILGEEKRKKQL